MSNQLPDRQEVLDLAERLRYEVGKLPATAGVLTNLISLAAELLIDLAPKEVSLQPGRCPWAKAFDTPNGKMTSRCKKNVTGHGKIHHARGFDEFPMLDLYWQPGDPDEFQSTRNDFYAWKE